ncbi:MAG: serine/threonine protein kinase [Polyangiaceae bacterium]|nr:serine/threonine protein kinase [Polyangiaceae bacterium]
MPHPRLTSDPEEPVLAPGDVLARKYRLQEPLGEGNMAVVWVAQNVALETRVAVKILKASLAADPRVVARFRQEAKATAAIAHKNIVQVYDYGVTNWGAPFIVMELLQGETLAQRLRKQGPLPPEEAVRVLMRVMKGVTVAHAKGIIHRDLKPENVFLVREENGSERPKVLDFGVSFVARSSNDDRLTKAGGIIGTPSYLPPEAVEGDNRGDARGDVWALGVMLYETLSGQLPFQGRTVHALLEAICKEPHPPLEGRIDGVDSALQRILDRALAKDPQERFPGVREFFDELNVWLSRRGLLLSTMVPRAATALGPLPHLLTLPADPMVDEDGPTLIGPSLDSSGQSPASSGPASQEKIPGSSHERISRARPADGSSSLEPSGMTGIPTAPHAGLPWAWVGGAGLLVVLGLGLLQGPLRARATPGVPPGKVHVPTSTGASATVSASAVVSASATASASAVASTVGGVGEEVVLDILGLPAGALLRVDGRKVAQLPVVLKRGQSVLVRVDAPGHEPWQQELVVEGSLKLRYTAKHLTLPPRTTAGFNYREVPY